MPAWLLPRQDLFIALGHSRVPRPPCCPEWNHPLPPAQDCNAAAGSSDYETWAVPKPDTCLLGAK